MSGFAGIFQLDGAPVDPAWLGSMLRFLSFRGPDGSSTYRSGNIGFCHTLLRTSSEDARNQISNLDNRLWITGDVRIDDRNSLISKLAESQSIDKNPSSLELVLHAYDLWGERCVDHLLGDFAFMIWDAPRKRVFCARDQLGIKLLFYALVNNCLIVSNTQDCIRELPVIPFKLNEQAIGDYLMAGMNQNPATTFFENIQRLPAASILSVEAGKIRTEKYWTPPIDEPLYYQRGEEYLEQFRELLIDAVRDRLPDGPLGVFMSGGLDSPALAAAAARQGAEVYAITWVFDRLIPDDERHFSGLVAKHLDIPIHYSVEDDKPWGWAPGDTLIPTTEPIENPLSLVNADAFVRDVSKLARVFFYGVGPDASLFYDWKPHLKYLIGERRFLRLGADLGLHFRAHRRIPLLSSLPQKFRERKSNQPDWYEPKFPEWINPAFAQSQDLRNRFNKAQETAPNHIRPFAHSNFASDFPLCGTANDFLPTGVPMDSLQPFADLRLLRFMMSVPAIPWCRNKYLIRTALRGWLPDEVLRRPKTPAAGFAYLERTVHMEKPKLPSATELELYVDSGKLPEWPGGDREELDLNLRVLGLQYWLVQLRS